LKPLGVTDLWHWWRVNQKQNGISGSGAEEKLHCLGCNHPENKVVLKQCMITPKRNNEGLLMEKYNSGIEIVI